MKKAKFIPSILLLILCVGVCSAGLFAITPMSNTIAGTVVVNGANAQVEISGYINDQLVFPAQTTRQGLTWEIPASYLTFETSNVDIVGEVEPIWINVRIKNKSSKGLGVYFYNGATMEGTEATHEHIQTVGEVKDGETKIANMYLESYSYIAPEDNNDQTINDQKDMEIAIKLADLFDNEKTGTFELKLNIEEYNPNVTYNSTTGLDTSSVPALLKLPTDSSFTAIPEKAYFENTNVKYVVIPSNIVDVGARCFAYCSNLVGVGLPNTINSIGQIAFTDSAMTKMPNFYSVTTASPAIFQRNIKMVVAKMPKGITSLPAGTFFKCYDLEFVDLSNVKTLNQNSCFNTCTSLVTIKGQLTDIGTEKTFRGCTSLKNIDVSMVETFSQEAFYECFELETIDISNAKTIGEHAFEFCSNLKNVVFGNKLEILEEEAFCMSGVTSIDFPNSIKEIGREAFYSAGNLSNITFPEVNIEVSIGMSAFFGTSLSGEMYLPDNYTLLGESNGQFMNTNVTSYRVNETNTKYLAIDGVLYKRKSSNSSSADYNVPSFLELIPPVYKTTYTFPATVTDQRRYEVSNCRTLKHIDVEEGNTAFSSVNGILYTADKLGVSVVPTLYPSTSIEVANGTKVIGGTYSSSYDQGTTSVLGDGFIRNRTVSVTLPTSTVAIAGCAMQPAYNLERVNSTTPGTFDFSGLPNLNYIGYKSLQHCRKMTKLKIGKFIYNGVEKEITMGDGFIQDAINLEYIYIDATIPPVVLTGEYTSNVVANNFVNLTNLKAIYVPKDYVQTYKDSPYWSSLADLITYEGATNS